MRLPLLSILCILLTFSCKTKDKTPKENYLPELFSLMQGSFNSEKQSILDTTYYNISLRMYPIWEDKGNFLYVEQALNSMQDKPYRVRIYEVTQENDSIYKSAIYTINNDSLWVGKWKTPEAFNSLTKEGIVLREGCAVYLKRLAKDHYKGETEQKTCESSLRGASYATSEVEIFADKIISWDRGFNSEDKHVWGAEKAGYTFDKIN